MIIHPYFILIQTEFGLGVYLHEYFYLLLFHGVSWMWAHKYSPVFPVGFCPLCLFYIWWAYTCLYLLLSCRLLWRVQITPACTFMYDAFQLRETGSVCIPA